MPVSLIKIFAIQLLKQINCYQENICHGDIKMANSLVDVKDDCVNFIFCDGLVGTAEFQEDNLEFGGLYSKALKESKTLKILKIIV